MDDRFFDEEFFEFMYRIKKNFEQFCKNKC